MSDFVADRWSSEELNGSIEMRGDGFIAIANRGDDEHHALHRSLYLRKDSKVEYDGTYDAYYDKIRCGTFSEAVKLLERFRSECWKY